jgi:hypothetical protein
VNKNISRVYLYTSKENHNFIKKLAKDANLTQSRILDKIISYVKDKKYKVKIDVSN